jgi:hypothetical protein
MDTDAVEHPENSDVRQTLCSATGEHESGAGVRAALGSRWTNRAEGKDQETELAHLPENKATLTPLRRSATVRIPLPVAVLHARRPLGEP